MRHLLLLICTLAVLGIVSCDKVDNPYVGKSTNAVIPTTPPTHVDSTTVADDAFTKMLVEDLTAHHCPNCPTASAQCELLYNAHSNHVIFMEENASLLAKRYLNPDSSYYNYYGCLADSEWNNTFINGDINGMPGTMVDRFYYSGTPGGPNDFYLNGVDVSAAPCDSIMSTPQTANIHIVDSMYAPPVSTVSMTITTKLNSVTPGNKYYLVVCLVEDSIFDWQDSLNVDRHYYLKRMTMRCAINNGGHGGGDSLSAVTTPQSKHYVYANTNYFQYNGSPFKTTGTPYWIQPSKWNMAHMYVVAFVYQRSTTAHDEMVLQVQKLHL